MLSDSESELLLLKAVSAAAGQLPFRKTTLNLYLRMQTTRKAVDNFNLPTEDLFTDVFTDKEDSGRGIITVSDKEIQARSSILVIVASYLIFPT